MNMETGADTAAGRLETRTPTLEARDLVKTFGHVVGLAGVSLQLYPGEVLAIIGDNGAGKSTLIKCLSGALAPDAGEILVDGTRVDFKSPVDARRAGIETVFQNLAVAPALDIASNLYLGREVRRKGMLGKILRTLDARGMRNDARDHLQALGIATVQDMSQKVETLSGGQRQAVAVARAARFGSKVIILDEPTAALGVRESGQVLQPTAGHPDQPQHAPGVRGGRPDPYPAAGPLRWGDNATESFHGGGGCDHDRGHPDR